MKTTLMMQSKTMCHLMLALVLIKQNSEADAHNDGSNEVIIVEADDSEEDETIISDNVPPPSQM